MLLPEGTVSFGSAIFFLRLNQGMREREKLTRKMSKEAVVTRVVVSRLVCPAESLPAQITRSAGVLTIRTQGEIEDTKRKGGTDSRRRKGRWLDRRQRTFCFTSILLLLQHNGGLIPLNKGMVEVCFVFTHAEIMGDCNSPLFTVSPVGPSLH